MFSSTNFFFSIFYARIMLKKTKSKVRNSWKKNNLIYFRKMKNELKEKKCSLEEKIAKKWFWVINKNIFGSMSKETDIQNWLITYVFILIFILIFIFTFVFFHAFIASLKIFELQNLKKNQCKWDDNFFFIFIFISIFINIWGSFPFFWFP